jgi:hypothetical protein
MAYDPILTTRMSYDGNCLGFLTIKRKISLVEDNIQPFLPRNMIFFYRIFEISEEKNEI